MSQAKIHFYLLKYDFISNKIATPRRAYETKELKCLVLRHVKTKSFSAPWRQDLPGEKSNKLISVEQRTYYILWLSGLISPIPYYSFCKTPWVSGT